MLPSCNTCWPLEWIFVATNEKLVYEAETIPPKAKQEQRDIYTHYAMSLGKEYYLQCPNAKRFFKSVLGFAPEEI